MLTWDEAWHESPTGSRIVVERPAGLALVLDARSGEPAVELHAGSTAAKSVRLFELPVDVPEGDAPEPGALPRERALVAVADGSLRAFELATGQSLGRSELHLGREVVGVQVGVAGATIRAASIATGIVVLTCAEVDGRTPVELRRIDGGELVASTSIGPYTSHAVSDDGHRVALVDAKELLVLDARTGEVRTRVALGAPPAGKHEGACAFHGPNLVALGWGNDDWSAPGAGIDVYDLTSGKLACRHQGSGFSLSLGGWVGDIESLPDIGRLAYSISACGLAYLVEDKTWTKASERDFGGGNNSPLVLSHTPGSARLFISGMTGHHARVVGTNALEQRAKDEVAGLFDLCESPSPTFASQWVEYASIRRMPPDSGPPMPSSTT